ncbi:hypothetical protein C2E23DRAFT_841431, partial [Lenzites betulinus]
MCALITPYLVLASHLDETALTLHTHPHTRSQLVSHWSPPTFVYRSSSQQRPSFIVS